MLTIVSLHSGDTQPNDVETETENDLSGIPGASQLVRGGIGIQAAFQLESSVP